MSRLKFLAPIALLSFLSPALSCGGDSMEHQSHDAGNPRLADADAAPDTEGAAETPDGAVQDADSAPPPEADDDDEAFAIDGERMLAHVAALADEALAGRLPGHEGNVQAAQYIADAFAELDLEPVGEDGGYAQRFEYPVWRELEIPTLTVAEQVLLEGIDYDILRYSPPATGEGELVFVGYGLRIAPFSSEEYPDCPYPTDGVDEYEGLELAGNLLVRFMESPSAGAPLYQRCPLEPRADFLAENGILGEIVIPDFSPGVNPGFAIGYILDPHNDYPHPVLIGDRDSFEALLPELSSWYADIADTHRSVSTRTGINAALHLEVERTEEQIPNILARARGADSALEEEVVIVGSHFDHVGFESGSGIIYHGADDNASGVALMLEMARAIASLPDGPRRTVLFAAWNAEETGMAGSCHYVANPLMPLDHTVATLNLDMVGSGDESGVLLLNGLEPQNAWLVQLMRDEARAHGLDYTIYPYTKVDQSDHYCFFESGIPALTVLSFGAHAEAHTPMDTLESITTTNLAITAELVWATLEPLAMGLEAQHLKEPQAH